MPDFKEMTTEFWMTLKAFAFLGVSVGVLFLVVFFFWLVLFGKKDKVGKRETPWLDALLAWWIFR